MIDSRVDEFIDVFAGIGGIIVVFVIDQTRSLHIAEVPPCAHEHVWTQRKVFSVILALY